MPIRGGYVSVLTGVCAFIYVHCIKSALSDAWGIANSSKRLRIGIISSALVQAFLLMSTGPVVMGRWMTTYFCECESVTWMYLLTLLALFVHAVRLEHWIERLDRQLPLDELQRRTASARNLALLGAALALVALAVGGVAGPLQVGVDQLSADIRGFVAMSPWNLMTLIAYLLGCRRLGRGGSDILPAPEAPKGRAAYPTDCRTRATGHSYRPHLGARRQLIGDTSSVLATPGFHHRAPSGIARAQGP